MSKADYRTWCTLMATPCNTPSYCDNFEGETTCIHQTYIPKDFSSLEGSATPGSFKAGEAPSECAILNFNDSLDKIKELIDHGMSLTIKPTFINITIYKDGEVSVNFSYDDSDESKGE